MSAREARQRAQLQKWYEQQIERANRRLTLVRKHLEDANSDCIEEAMFELKELVLYHYELLKDEGARRIYETASLSATGRAILQHKQLVDIFTRRIGDARQALVKYFGESSAVVYELDKAVQGHQDREAEIFHGALVKRVGAHAADFIEQAAEHHSSVSGDFAQSYVTDFECGETALRIEESERADANRVKFRRRLLKERVPKDTVAAHVRYLFNVEPLPSIDN